MLRSAAKDDCLNTACRGNIRSAPQTSLLVHIRRCSVILTWCLQLKLHARRPSTGESHSMAALGQTGHLFSSLICTDPSIPSSLIKPMIKYPRFAFVEELSCMSSAPEHRCCEVLFSTGKVSCEVDLLSNLSLKWP